MTDAETNKSNKSLARTTRNAFDCRSIFQKRLITRTIYRYLRDKSFQKDFRDTRRATVDNADSALQQATCEAVDTLKRNMSCENPQAEIRSAQIILDMAFKGIEMADILGRLETLENANTKQTQQT